MHVGSTLSSRPAAWHGRSRRTARVAAWAGVALALSSVAAAAACVRRVVVVGESMTPTFPPGDRLLVVRLSRRSRLRPGDVVAAADPRVPTRLLVKRVASCTGDGDVVLLGDNAARSTDSRELGAFDRRSVWGLVRYRYAPTERSGAIGRGRAGRSAG